MMFHSFGKLKCQKIDDGKRNHEQNPEISMCNETIHLLENPWNSQFNQKEKLEILFPLSSSRLQKINIKKVEENPILSILVAKP